MLLRKLFFTSFLIVFSHTLFSQIPDGYYDSATGTGYNLKTQLHNIIKDHTSISYSGVWDAIYTTDVRPDGYVWDMYSDVPGGVADYYYNLGSDQCGNYSGEGSCYNREHSFPKSWFYDASPMYTDLFHLYPTDGYVNGKRGNYPFGEVGSVNWESTNGSKLGTCNYPGYSGTVFEPIDEYKGDFARTYFYMATRYENEINTWTSDMLDGSNDQCFSDWAIEMLIEWHTNDPVSQKEVDRNDAVYDIQANRNPFIDHPEFVAQIWGGGENVPPSITNIAISPQNPNSAESVTVSATITDTDGAITSSHLNWGLNAGSLSNTINMSNSTGDNYVTDTPIPAQADGTTIYYTIEAEDDSAAISTSSIQSYTVNDEGAVGLPFEEDFEMVTQYEPIDIEGWHIYNEAGTVSWEGREHNGNKYAQMSAYDTEEASNISWLITPEINLSDITSAQFSFKSKDGYNNGEVLTVLISNDYNGSGDPNAANWNVLNPEIANNAPSDGYASEFVFSGELDISNYIDQTICIAFKYVGGDGSVTTTMQIDDVLISGETASNIAPEISNINYSPENPESSDNVYVSASISDPDGSVNSATIKWGNSAGNYTNQEEMSLENDNNYLGVIPPQPDQTWVYFIIEAEDNEEGITTSEEIIYQVVDPENQSPIISEVVLDPENPTENDNVIISASVVDLDGSVESVILKWNKNDEASQEQNMNLSGGKYYGQISKQASGVTVNFSILAIDDLGAESTFEDSYEVSEASSIENVELSKIKIFPNPASSKINVVIPGYIGTLDFKLFDAIGSLVLNETKSFNQEGLIQLKGLVSGVYFLRISTESGFSTTRRLVVNH
ncbi:MAG: endonuclease [Thiohalospira sp.]